MDIALDFVKFVGYSMIAPFKGHFIEQDDNVQTRGISFRTTSANFSSLNNDNSIINTQNLEFTKSAQKISDIKNKNTVKIQAATNVDRIKLDKEEQINNIFQGRY